MDESAPYKIVKEVSIAKDDIYALSCNRNSCRQIGKCTVKMFVQVPILKISIEIL